MEFKINIRDDFEEVKVFIARLFEYSLQYKSWQEDWSHYAHKEDFDQIYHWESPNKEIIESIYSEGRQFGWELIFVLQSFTQIDKCPDLTSYINCINEYWESFSDNIFKVISEVEEVAKTIEDMPWAVNRMIPLYKSQIELFDKVKVTVEILKKSKLYLSEQSVANINEIQLDIPHVENSSKKDIFICHASEDKLSIVIPLTKKLEENGISYWLDEGEIKWGDSIFLSINKGINDSRYVLIVVSDAFLDKDWPKAELDAFFHVEMRKKYTVILPLLCGDDSTKLKFNNQLPLIAGKSHKRLSDGLDSIIDDLKGMLK